MSISSLFKQTAMKLPDKVAIEFEDKRATFMDIDLQANKVANALERAGILKGDRVAHFMPNSMELVYSLVGNFKNGSIVVPMNIGFKEQEIHHILSDSGAKAAVTDAERLPVVKNAAKSLPELKQIILVDGKNEQNERNEQEANNHEGYLQREAHGEGGYKIYSFSEMIKNASDKEPSTRINDIKDEDYSIIFYTSGTTGKPKGAALSQINVTSNLKALEQAWRWSKDDVFLLALPLYHIHGIGVALCGSLYVGSFAILKKKFSAEDALDTIQKRRVTLFMGVPTMYFKLLETDSLERFNLSSMRLYVSGSAPLSKDLFYKLKKALGHEVLERAGMSESMMNFSNPYNGERVPGSVGHCLPGVKLRIADKSYNDVSIGTEGEILIKGPNVFNGYWNKKSYNRQIFKDGWFVTGDVGKIDEKGYVYIIGRSKDIIISGGINIYPREIEDVIESIPAVKECAVVGVPDKEFGESVKAYVVLNGNVKLTEDYVIDYCKEKLASFKKPKFVEFIDILPKNTMGKIIKEELRKMHKKV